jgi:excisionase family DNA binding protein
MTGPATPRDTLIVTLPDKPWLTSGEVAAAFHVDQRTAQRWADQGRLTVERTAGGHRRYSRAEVAAYLTAGNLS